MDAPPGGSNKKLKACNNCTNAKTKCTPYGNLNNLCERCHRLGKTCTYAEATVRPKKNRLSSRKQLEEKVDSLVNLLSTIQSNEPRANIPPSIVNSRSPALRTRRSSSFDSSPAGDSGLGSSSLDSPYTAPDWSGPDVLDSLPLETMNQLFSLYCRKYVQEFPFVTFTLSETVSTMQINRPLTLKSLLAITLVKDLNMQRKATFEIVDIIKKNMMSRSTYSFDLLQAIVIQAAFYHYQFRSTNQELLLMVQYAITLAHEVGIDKSHSDRRSGMISHGLTTEPMEGVKYEQWRTLLGVYYEAAVFAQAFRKPRLMQYTRYMDQCRRRLLETIEMQTDYSIDAMISMQNVCLDAHDVFTLYDFENAEVSGDLAIKSLVVGFTDRLKMIQERLQNLRGTALLLPNEQRLLIYARAYVHEVAIHKDFWSSPDPQKLSMSATRSQLGWKGLELAKELASYYANLPAAVFLTMDTSPVTQMLYSLIMLNKYVSFDNVDASPSASNQWDVQLAFKEAELQRLGNQIIGLVASLVTVEKLYDDSRPIWWALGWIIKNMVHGHQQRICSGLLPIGRRPRGLSKEDPLVETATPMTQSSVPEENHTPAKNESTDPDTRPVETPFAMSFPDITFDNSMVWQEGMFQMPIWDTMMNDMTTLPFGWDT